MENSIKEDIKNIEEIIELSKEEIDAKAEDIIAILDIEDLISLEHILSDYKKILKENESWKSYSEEIEEEQIEKNNKNCELEFEVEKLQKENEELKNQEATARKINELLVQRYSNSISVQKVKDKIEQYKKMLLSCNRFSDAERIKAINERILELEELLKGRKQNVQVL